MDEPTRRSVLFGGAAIVGGAAASLAGMQAVGAAAAGGMYIWAVNTAGVVVPSDTWTKIRWPRVVLNSTAAEPDTVKMPWPHVPYKTTGIHRDDDGATWIFPVPSTSGIYAMLCNVAWDNARAPSGAPISPPAHRKLARILQQNTGFPQNDQTAYLGASTELTYTPELALRRSQRVLSDGTMGYQQQQVYVQAGIALDIADQRTWVEVYQDSGQPLMCRWDGSTAPKTGTRPPIVGLQAPSLMIAKVCDF